MRRLILFSILGILIVLLIFDYTSRSSWRGAMEKLSAGGHFNVEEPEADIAVPDKLLTLKQVHEKLGEPSESNNNGRNTVDVYRWQGCFYTYVMKVEYQGKGPAAGAVKIRPRSVMRLVQNEADVLPDFLPIEPQPQAPVGGENGQPPLPAGATAAGAGSTTPGETTPDENKPGENKPGEEKPDEAKPGETKPGEKKPGESAPAKAPSDDPAAKKPAAESAAEKDKNPPSADKSPPKAEKPEAAGKPEKGSP
ncbi:MAG: hypothetical protein HYS13_02745 [Planctomycetia bacterium]|nr:hypothetical protein [Planctomycetia bacterium]